MMLERREYSWMQCGSCQQGARLLSGRLNMICSLSFLFLLGDFTFSERHHHPEDLLGHSWPKRWDDSSNASNNGLHSPTQNHLFLKNSSCPWQHFHLFVTQRKYGANTTTMAHQTFIYWIFFLILRLGLWFSLVDDEKTKEYCVC